MPGEVWGLILAAGDGTRFGDRKQFRNLGGSSLVARVVSTARQVCDELVLVLPAGYPWEGQPVTAVVAGGATRAGSVRAGLAAVDPAAEIVVVHDAAHPLASMELFRTVIAAVGDGADGAVPGVDVVEALKRVEDGRVLSTVPRQGLMQAQMPQAFQAQALRAAHTGGPEATEDSELLEARGKTVVVVPGDVRNIHITTPRELDVAADVLAAST